MILECSWEGVNSSFYSTILAALGNWFLTCQHDLLLPTECEGKWCCANSGQKGLRHCKIPSCSFCGPFNLWNEHVLVQGEWRHMKQTSIRPSAWSGALQLFHKPVSKKSTSWFYFQGPLSPLPSAVPSSASATTSPGLQERARPELVSGAGALQPLTLEDGIFSETSLKHVLKFLALHLLGDF